LLHRASEARIRARYVGAAGELVMATAPLNWLDGEGYDLHVLRNGPPSKALDASIDFDQQFPAASFPLVFTPHFKGAPNSQGISVNTTTGAVTATAAPAPKLRNFLMTVSQARGTDSAETRIRIHIHDSIQKIWLTPATLTVPGVSAAQPDLYKFTVLALFDDDTMGDITDWPQVTLKSADTSIADVLPGSGGAIKVVVTAAMPSNQNVAFTAALTLAAPQTNLTTAPATVFPKPTWSNQVPTWPVEFVDGPVRPNFGNGDPTDELNGPDLGTTNKDSIPNVANPRTNILFVSEGFTQAQQGDFNKAVANVVASLATPIFEPFKLLKGSFNYWRLFVPSQDSGISLLGEYEISGTGANQFGVLQVPRPAKPDPSATSWSLPNMIHELGLPAPQDPVLNINDAVAQWTQLYDTKVTSALVSASFQNWNDLRTRSPLNERDTVFGFADSTRPRVSDTSEGDALLRPSWRRTPEATLDTIFTDLVVPATNPPNPQARTFTIGQFWTPGGKDRGLVCFICLSDLGDGEDRPGYFAAMTGYEFRPHLSASQNGGLDVNTFALSDPKAPFSADILASRVAHECAHAFGVGDEYGSGDGTSFTGPVLFPNLQSKSALTPNQPTIYDPTLIKWLLPRAFKVAKITAAPVNQGGNVFQIKLDQIGQFAKGDLVLIRQPPVSGDPFKTLRFTVDQTYTSPAAVDVIQSSGPTLDADLLKSFNLNALPVLICASSSTSKGAEVKLVADKTLAYIGQNNSPLNGAPGAACVAPPKGASSTMTPNSGLKGLTFKQKPASPADIIGLYEGGAHVDCGVFRPAGRCKLRNTIDTKIPFCQVCRYIIVDRVDATLLPALDKLYDPFYPT
jgi:hypothetical protein